MSFRERVLRIISPRKPDEFVIPDDDDNEAIEGILTSIESYREAHGRRPEVENVVEALAEYKRANHFGEKLDYVFTRR